MCTVRNLRSPSYAMLIADSGNGKITFLSKLPASSFVVSMAKHFLLRSYIYNDVLYVNETGLCTCLKYVELIPLIEYNELKHFSRYGF